MSQITLLLFTLPLIFSAPCFAQSEYVRNGDFSQAPLSHDIARVYTGGRNGKGPHGGWHADKASTIKDGQAEVHEFLFQIFTIDKPTDCAKLTVEIAEGQAQIAVYGLTGPTPDKPIYGLLVGDGRLIAQAHIDDDGVDRDLVNLLTGRKLLEPTELGPWNEPIEYGPICKQGKTEFTFGYGKDYPMGRYHHLGSMHRAHVDKFAGHFEQVCIAVRPVNPKDGPVRIKSVSFMAMGAWRQSRTVKADQWLNILLEPGRIDLHGSASVAKDAKALAGFISLEPGSELHVGKGARLEVNGLRLAGGKLQLDEDAELHVRQKLSVEAKTTVNGMADAPVGTLIAGRSLAVRAPFDVSGTKLLASSASVFVHSRLKTTQDDRFTSLVVTDRGMYESTGSLQAEFFSLNNKQAFWFDKKRKIKVDNLTIGKNAKIRLAEPITFFRLTLGHNDALRSESSMAMRLGGKLTLTGGAVAEAASKNGPEPADAIAIELPPDVDVIVRGTGSVLRCQGSLDLNRLSLYDGGRFVQSGPGDLMLHDLTMLRSHLPLKINGNLTVRGSLTVMAQLMGEPKVEHIKSMSLSGLLRQNAFTIRVIGVGTEPVGISAGAKFVVLTTAAPIKKFDVSQFKIETQNVAVESDISIQILDKEILLVVPAKDQR